MQFDEVEKYKDDLDGLYKKLFDDCKAKKLSRMQEVIISSAYTGQHLHITPARGQTKGTLSELFGLMPTISFTEERIGLDIPENLE